MDSTNESQMSGRASQLRGPWRRFYEVLSVGLALFALWSAGPGIPEENLHLGTFTLAMWVLSFLRIRAKKSLWFILTKIFLNLKKKKRSQHLKIILTKLFGSL